MQKIIKVIIPAFNEEGSIAKVINDIPNFVKEIVVVDNNSTDRTSEMAKNSGATVLFQKEMGYGNACLMGVDYIKNHQEKTDILVFIDGDYSDYPEEMELLIEPIITKNVDLVIGARTAALRQKKSMTPQQVFGNFLATFLMKHIYGARFTDLGPFRAIQMDKLLALNMKDKTYGWTVEMQIKALKNNYSYTEIPVNYRERIGVSKVSGTLKGTIMAGYKILSLIFKYSWK